MSYLSDDVMRSLISMYTDMLFTGEAISELRFHLEDELDELLRALEDGVYNESQYRELLGLIRSIQKLIDQRRLKRVVLQAVELARDRGRDIVGVEEVCDSFGGN